MYKYLLLYTVCTWTTYSWYVNRTNGKSSLYHQLDISSWIINQRHDKFSVYLRIHKYESFLETSRLYPVGPYD